MLANTKIHKAVYSRGRLETGLSHGEAFAKLPSELKQGNDFLIGVWNEQTGKFCDDDYNKIFFTKKILMVRHGLPDYSQTIDPALSWKGKLGVARTAIEILHDEDWSQYHLFCGTAKRCQETKEILQVFLRLQEDTVSDVDEIKHKETYYNYQQRIIRFLEKLPQKSLIVSHCPFIESVVQLIRGDNQSAHITPASMTLVDHNKIVYLALSA